MRAAREPTTCLVTVAAYAAAVAYSIVSSRVDGGIAMVWIAGAVLAARLADLRRRAWPAVVLACVLANVLVTGLVGLGWSAALPLALVNAGEAVAAALILRVLLRTCWPFDALEVVAGYYLGIGIAVPLCGAVVATMLLPLVLPGPLPHGFFHWFIGHSVGLIMAIPVSLMATRLASGRLRSFDLGEGASSALQLATMALLTHAVFMQSAPVAILLPVAFVVVVGWKGNPIVATALPVVLGAVGGRLTRAGHGPFRLLDLATADRMQVFALYAAAVMLCVLPLLCDRAARRRRTAEPVLALE
ncbi:MASE1 domain-containing protein [Novosphingobium huizhouense]|uniref:MASE1 domain-containing protein n=1 Tax=Novosphingobium huizhouense TaxID=2866625 RepID=UPI001CD82DEE|nr:MASE1 domain-containing protein [Novosphingobium huizhouense]